jgi:Arc/MetJ family transcription regulator
VTRFAASRDFGSRRPSVRCLTPPRLERSRSKAKLVERAPWRLLVDDAQSDGGRVSAPTLNIVSTSRLGTGFHGEPRAGPYTYRTPYVYVAFMPRIRTNVELDDVYLKRIMDRYGIHTKTEAVDLALRHLAGQPMTRDEALAMEGAHAIGNLPADSAPE